MSYSITVKFEFPYGHRLMNHTGPCKYVHGHNGILVVCLSRLDGGLNQDNMVVDFGFVKTYLRSFISTSVDHAFFINKNDLELKELIKKYQYSVIELDGDPTSEAIAKFFYTKIQDFFKDSHKVNWVEFHESSTTYSRYEPDN